MKKEEQESSSSHNSNSPVAPEPGEMFLISTTNRQFQDDNDCTQGAVSVHILALSVYLFIQKSKKIKIKINNKEECAYFCYLQYTWSLSQLPSGESWGKISQGKIERNAKKT